jgi:hypothetical protein
VSPEELVSWGDRRWTSACVAGSLPALAPHLAPRNFVCFANKLIHQIFDGLQSPAFLLGWPDRMGHNEVGSR